MDGSGGRSVRHSVVADATRRTRGSTDAMRSLIWANKSQVKRAFRRADVSGSGTLPSAAAARVVMTVLTLNPQRDGAVVQAVCDAAAIDGIVALETLLQRPAQLPVDSSRYRAPGIMDVTIQKATTGCEATPLGYHYRGPPFAVLSDADQMTAIIESFHSSRRDKLGEKLRACSADGVWLTHAEFAEAARIIDKYALPEVEVTSLIDALDPGRKRGRVNIEQFIARYGVEYLRNKSSRASVGAGSAASTLEWPTSLEDRCTRRELLAKMRSRKATKSKGRTKHGGSGGGGGGAGAGAGAGGLVAHAPTQPRPQNRVTFVRRAQAV